MPLEIKQNVRLLMHLPGGYSKVLVEMKGGVGLAGGEVTSEIPTNAMPANLTSIGSQFVVVQTGLTGQEETEKMTPSEIRAAISYRVIETIDENG